MTCGWLEEQNHGYAAHDAARKLWWKTLLQEDIIGYAEKIGTMREIPYNGTIIRAYELCTKDYVIMSPRHPLIQGWQVTVIGDMHFVTKVMINAPIHAGE